RFSGRGSPRRYACPLNWLPASRFAPRAAGWSAATLCFGTKLPTRDVSVLITIGDKPDPAKRPSTSLLEDALKTQKIVAQVQIALDFPGQGSLAIDRRRLLLGRRPAWPPECRACGGASIASGAMPTQREDVDGQTANQQTRKGGDEGRWRRG